MIKKIFTYANLLDTSAVFLRILRAPDIRELVNFGGHRDSRKKYWETLNAIAENIKKYLTVVLQSKGPRTTVNQRAYRTVLAACTGSNLRRQKNLRLASDVLVRTCDASILCCCILCCGCTTTRWCYFYLQGIMPRNVRRGLQDRNALEEHPGSGFVACSRKTYRNKMPDKVCMSETYKEG